MSQVQNRPAKRTVRRIAPVSMIRSPACWDWLKLGRENPLRSNRPRPCSGTSSSAWRDGPGAVHLQAPARRHHDPDDVLFKDEQVRDIALIALQRQVIGFDGGQAEQGWRGEGHLTFSPCGRRRDPCAAWEDEGSRRPGQSSAITKRGAPRLTPGAVRPLIFPTLPAARAPSPLPARGEGKCCRRHHQLYMVPSSSRFTGRLAGR